MQSQQLKVNIKTPAGDVLQYEVSPSDKIQTIQERIKESTGIHEKDQQLEVLRDHPKSESNRSFLQNWTFEEAGIKDGDTIELFIRKGGVKLYFKTPDGKVQELYSDYYDTIASTKQLIEEKTGHFIESQRIVFAGKLIENHKRLIYYGIQKESTLSVLLK